MLTPINWATWSFGHTILVPRLIQNVFPDVPSFSRGPFPGCKPYNKALNPIIRVTNLPAHLLICSSGFCARANHLFNRFRTVFRVRNGIVTLHESCVRLISPSDFLPRACVRACVRACMRACVRARDRYTRE